MSNSLLKDIRQVGGWIGRDDQRTFTLVSIADRVRASHAGLTHTTLAREEDELSHFVPPFNALLISSNDGYAPTLITLP